MKKTIKYTGLGCLGIVLITVLIGVVAVLTDSSSDSDTTQTIQDKEIDLVLEFNVEEAGSGVNIYGETNLPERTKLSFILSRGGKVVKGASNVLVKQGKYNKYFEIGLSNIEEVWISCNADDRQEKEVLSQLQHIKTPMWEDSEFKPNARSFTIKKVVDNTHQKKLQAADLGFEKPSDFKESYKKALANFMLSWRNKNWNEMQRYTQQSQNETAKSLKNTFGDAQIKGFEIKEIRGSGNLIRIKSVIYFSHRMTDDFVHKSIHTCNVINEGGHWGVNATSMRGYLAKALSSK